VLSNASKILYVTQDDAGKADWLHGYYLAAAFRKRFPNVALFGPPARHRRDQLRFGAWKVLSRQLLGSHFSIAVEPPIVRHYGEQIDRLAREGEASLIFSNNPIPVGSLGGDIPYVIHTDATYTGLKRLGVYFDGTQRRTERNWERFDRAAVTGASAVFFSSRWAADVAIEDYGLDPDRVHFVPQGANIEPPELDEDALMRTPGEICRLLFFGSDWERKGGEVAYETLLGLRELGVAATLAVCGPSTLPERLRATAGVELVPRIDKNNEADARRLAELFGRSDFLVLPTRADCTPVAIAEATAYGVPSIASDVGGIPSMIEEGVSGYMLPVEATGADYAGRIAESFGDPSEFARLRREARRTYVERLNWEVAVRQIEDVLAEKRLI